MPVEPPEVAVDEEPRCGYCDRPEDDCRCDYCEDCGSHNDDCRCEYCGTCERHYDECVCCGCGSGDPAGHCGRCDVCPHCGDLNDECECCECGSGVYGPNCTCNATPDYPPGRENYVPPRITLDPIHFESADDPDVSGPRNGLLFTELPNRPLRLVSCEQEVTLGGSYIAEALFTAGLSGAPYMMDYHSEQRRGSPTSRGFCRVEEDASVAGEIIWPKLQLDSPSVAKRLHQGIELVREARRQDLIKIGMAAGFHIHVDATDLTAHDLSSVYHLWCHVEDTMYRLASANWACHRDEATGAAYASAVKKGMKRCTEVAQGNDAHGGLNLGNAFQARRNCECGASGLGLWHECSCALPKCTVEFRVFNATVNPIKWRAYIALSLAIVTYAKGRTINAETHPEFGWLGTNGQDVERSRATLDFILRKLPMEPEDRKAVRYCAKRSSLAAVYAKKP